MEKMFPHASRYISVIRYGGDTLPVIVSSKNSHVTTVHIVDLNKQTHRDFLGKIEQKNTDVLHLFHGLERELGGSVRLSSKEITFIKEADITIYRPPSTRSKIRIRQVSRPNKPILS